MELNTATNGPPPVSPQLDPGGTASSRSLPTAAGSDCHWETLDGAAHAVIEGVDSLPPFLMNVVSNGDAWLFLGSNGGLTAGRRSPDHAIFPYRTADKLLRQPHDAGIACMLRIDRRLWEPWRPGHPVAGRPRRLLKHELCTSVIFEEEDVESGLRLRWRLSPSAAHGLVRACSLENLGPRTVDLEVLDGWHQVLPPGVAEQMYARFSYLAAAYMRHELLADSGLGIFTLNAAISDRPEPAESLRASVAWSLGHRTPVRLLSERHLDEFRTAGLGAGAAEVRGEFGAYLVHDRLRLAPGEKHEWLMGIDTGLDHAAIVDLRHRLARPEDFRNAVVDALEEEVRGIRRRVAAADGLQRTADRGATVHHCSNTLYNIMRGGTFHDGYRCPPGDVAAFLRLRNRPLLARHAAWVESAQAVDIDGLRASAAGQGDRQLLRLINEYLPLGFSRRHGDPSRPWNRFVIETIDSDGRPILAYSGNWRDVFQNWEALGYSHPGYIGGMIAVFLNASTADGYNPYRISRAGIDWEVPDPADPWSHIGYWGDHQIVYLLRLLQAHERFWPGALSATLDERRYSAAIVPYKIADFDALVRDPRHSISFDSDLHGLLLERAAAIGSDGRLLPDATGEPQLFSLAEKLLTPVLVKMSNFVPGGGVWLNTQRPEWNDANNALAGWGLSVVTACHIRCFLDLLDRLLAASPHGEFEMSEPLAGLAAGIGAALSAPTGADPVSRRKVFEALGRAGAAHRAAVYARKDGRVSVAKVALRKVISQCQTLVDATIRANRRDDGTYSSYNVLDLDGGALDIRPLGLMLEGQVAVLSSGLLTDAEAADLLDALAKSPLFRPDQNSYMLQPDRPCTPFLERNRLPADWRDRAPGLAALVAAGDRSIVAVDREGTARFHADITNAGDVKGRVAAVAAVDAEANAVLGLWEDVFAHREFTGRSGSFFAFEGLGSIYWHMVAKLLLATQECHDRAAEPSRGRLAGAYHRIRDGLGFRKTAAEYGAFPSDAYSHTPRHSGAQQPGMTGQVKEEILTRLGELGVRVTAGQVRFAPTLLLAAEILPSGGRFGFVAVDGSECSVPLSPRSLAFTFCQVPVIYRFGCPSAALVLHRGETSETIAGDTLPASAAAEIFRRTGAISCIEVMHAGEGP